MDYVKVNAELWDEWAKDDCAFSIPISHEDFVKIHDNEWNIFATPLKPVPKHWFGNLNGKRVLCLAGGGGQQAPIFAALGAEVTVFDVSQAQLDLDKLVAEREKINLILIKGDMSKRLPFEDEYFDIIFNPVSTTYIQKVEPLWKECYRILRKNGHLITGIANPDLFAFEITKDELELKYPLPYDPLKNNYETPNDRFKDVQFSHSITTQIGGQLKAGFILQDLYEDHHCISSNNRLKAQMKPAKIAEILTNFLPIYIVTLSKK